MLSSVCLAFTCGQHRAYFQTIATDVLTAHYENGILRSFVRYGSIDLWCPNYTVRYCMLTNYTLSVCSGLELVI